MTWRHALRGLFLAWLPIAGVGCVLTEPHIKTDSLAPSIGLQHSQPEVPAPAATELPANEAARVCLQVAIEQEKNGHDVEALVQYERARQKDSKIPNLSRKLAVLYDKVGNDQKALEEYHKALAAQPADVELLNNLGYFYYSRRKLPEAEEHLRKAVKLDAKHARAWMNLGLTLGQMSRYPEALEAFGHAVSPAEAQSNLGFILATQGKREEAKDAYRQALRLQPNLMIAQQALARLENPQPQNDGGSQTPLNPGRRPITPPERPRSSDTSLTLPLPGPSVVPGTGE